MNTETNLSALLRGIDHSNRLEVVLLPPNKKIYGSQKWTYTNSIVKIIRANKIAIDDVSYCYFTSCETRMRAIDLKLDENLPN